MITVENYADLIGFPPTADPVFVKGKLTAYDGGEGVFYYDSSSEEVINDGTIVQDPLILTGRWKRVIEEKVNVQWFGAVPDCYKGHDKFHALPNGTPCHVEIQKAIDFCIAYGYDLYFPAGRRDEYGVHGEYLVKSTLKIVGRDTSFPPEESSNSQNRYATLNIYAEANATITGDLGKTSPILLFEGCKQGKIENLTIQGCGYLPLAGIQFMATPIYDDCVAPESEKCPYPYEPCAHEKVLTSYLNSEGMELYNVKIYNCRHGVYSEQGETLNRVVFNRCVFVANLIAGFYLKSENAPGANGYAGSAPITFTNTIINGNGVPEFLVYKPELKNEKGEIIREAYNPPKYKGITVLNEDDKYGYQLYAHGFGNISYFGGQISGHGGSRMLSLATFDDGAGVNLMGVDIEDIHSAVDQAGNYIVDYSQDYGSLAGAAFIVRQVSGFNLIQSHVWNLNTQSVFKFANNCGDVNIELMDLHYPYAGDFLYSVDVIQSNYGIDDNITRLTYTGRKDKLSTTAFVALDKSGMEVLTSIGGPIVSPKMDSIFTHFNAAGVHYSIGYKGNGTYINTTNALYIDKEIVYGTIFHAMLECSQASFDPDGIFFIQQFNEVGNIISEERTGLKGIVKIDINPNPINTNPATERYYNYLTCKLDPLTVKIRYGFVNNQNYVGNVPDNATIKGLTTYIDYHNPIQKRRPVGADF